MSEIIEFDSLEDKPYFGEQLVDYSKFPKEPRGVPHARVGVGMAFRIRPLNISKVENKAFLGTPGSGKAFRIDQKERCMADN